MEKLGFTAVSPEEFAERLVENTAGPEATNSDQSVMSAYSAVSGGIFGGLVTWAGETKYQTAVYSISREEVVHNPWLIAGIGVSACAAAGLGMYNGIKAYAIRHLGREEYDRLRK